MFSSSGMDACSVCDAGYYCASNETSAADMITGGGSWGNFSGSSGMCFNGTYCAAGMTRAPGDTLAEGNGNLGAVGPEVAHTEGLRCES